MTCSLTPPSCSRCRSITKRTSAPWTTPQWGRSQFTPPKIPLRSFPNTDTHFFWWAQLTVREHSSVRRRCTPPLPRSLDGASQSTYRRVAGGGVLLTAPQSLLSSKRVMSAEADSLEIKIKSHPRAARKDSLRVSQRLRLLYPRHNSENVVSPLTLMPGIHPGCFQAAAELPLLQDKAGAGEAVEKILENIFIFIHSGRRATMWPRFCSGRTVSESGKLFFQNLKYVLDFSIIEPCPTVTRSLYQSVLTGLIYLCFGFSVQI